MLERPERHKLATPQAANCQVDSPVDLRRVVGRSVGRVGWGDLPAGGNAGFCFYFVVSLPYRVLVLFAFSWSQELRQAARTDPTGSAIALIGLSAPLLSAIIDCRANKRLKKRSVLNNSSQCQCFGQCQCEFIRQCVRACVSLCVRVCKHSRAGLSRCVSLCVSVCASVCVSVCVSVSPHADDMSVCVLWSVTS